MKKVIGFANNSAKKSEVFQRHLGRSFKGLCETRWSERHDGIMQFQNNISEIVESLEEISEWQDIKTSSDAYSYIQSVCDTEFLVSTICLSDILSTTRPLSLLLQAPSMDLVMANDAVKSTINILQTRRRSADSYFTDLFSKITTLAEKMKSSIDIPLAAKRQIYRSSNNSSSAVLTTEEYYRQTIFIPLLDYVVVDIQDRLPEGTLKIFNLNLLMPSYIFEGDHSEKTILKDIESLAVQFQYFVGNQSSNLVGEYQMWKEHWKNKKDSLIPKSSLEILDSCNNFMYPTINSLLKILVTLPVSVATAERTFSTLRRLKSWLRTRMGEERLTGLALMHIHFDISLDIEKILEKFVKKKNRKLDFVI